MKCSLIRPLSLPSYNEIPFLQRDKRSHTRALRRARDRDCILFILVYCFRLSTAGEIFARGMIYRFTEGRKNAADRADAANECIGIISRGSRKTARTPSASH